MGTKGSRLKNIQVTALLFCQKFFYNIVACIYFLKGATMIYDYKTLPEDYDSTSMKKEFEESYEILCATNEPFHVKMKKIYELKQIDSKVRFELKTGLHTKFYKEFIREGYIPRMNTFISMCMGFGLDLPAAESLLASLSLGFEKTNRLDCAYMFLLTHYQGMSIDDCNIVLKDLGFTEKKELLGSNYKEE